MDPITIPQPECQHTLFPTKAQLMSCFGEIANLPAKLKAEIAKLKTQATSFDVEKELQKIKEDFSKEATELKQKLLAQAEQIQQQIEAELQEQIASLLEEIEKIQKYLEKIEKLIDSFLASMSTPVYTTLRAKVLEWERRITAMTQEFQLYVQIKILQLISDIIPISFIVNVFGLQVDLVKLFTDKNYQAQLKAQIKKDIDKFYNMLEDEYKSFIGYFGLDSLDIKIEVFWSNLMSKLQRGALELLWDAFSKLIDKFNSIWDSLGLPNIPNLANLNVKDLIKNAIAELKQKVIDGIAEIRQKIQQKVEAIENAAKEAVEEVKQQILAQAMKIEEEVIAKIQEIREIMAKIEKVLKNLGLSLGSWSFNVMEMIGGEIDDAIMSIERRIDRYIEALRDFGEHLPQRLFFMWIDDIMQFLNQIGLDSILNWLTFDFCDFMNLIGIPKTIDLESKFISKLPV